MIFGSVRGTRVHCRYSPSKLVPGGTAELGDSGPSTESDIIHVGLLDGVKEKFRIMQLSVRADPAFGSMVRGHGGSELGKTRRDEVGSGELVARIAKHYWLGILSFTLVYG